MSIKHPLRQHPLRLQLSGISKRYGSLAALDNVSLSVRAGEVHGLLGENGAGKSTLLNILSGVTHSDTGSIEINGEKQIIRKPLDARAAGIAMIHQELQHVPELSVAQNLFLGRACTKGFGLFVARAEQERRSLKVLRELDPSIDPRVPIKALTVAQRQLVEIARALLEEASVIAMDEPTSSLTPSEFERLAQLVVDLANKGVAIIYVSHKMDEVFSLCQKVTILRDGQLVDVVELAGSSEREVTEKMVGRELVSARHRSHATSNVVLEVEGLSRSHHVVDASFKLHKGEVLGISGLVGAGRTELVRLIAGIDRPEQGCINLKGRPVKAADPRAAIQAGIGLLPEERKRDGIVLSAL